MIEVDIEKIGTIDLSRAINMFPALMLFTDMYMQAVMLWLESSMQRGLDIETMQAYANGDRFAITLAGSVYARIQGDPSYGCVGVE